MKIANGLLLVLIPAILGITFLVCTEREAAAVPCTQVMANCPQTACTSSFGTACRTYVSTDITCNPRTGSETLSAWIPDPTLMCGTNMG